MYNYIEKNSDIMNPLYDEHFLPVPWPFVISRFQCAGSKLDFFGFIGLDRMS